MLEVKHIIFILKKTKNQLCWIKISKNFQNNINNNNNNQPLKYNTEIIIKKL